MSINLLNNNNATGSDSQRGSRTHIKWGLNPPWESALLNICMSAMCTVRLPLRVTVDSKITKL